MLRLVCPFSDYGARVAATDTGQDRRTGRGLATTGLEFATTEIADVEDGG
jgi:hypothetical protein